MRPPVAAFVLLSLGLPGALSGQAIADSAQVPLRIATITAGIGNAMGWFRRPGETAKARVYSNRFVELWKDCDSAYGCRSSMRAKWHKARD